MASSGWKRLEIVKFREEPEMQVLLVEPNPACARALTALLSTAGFDFVTAPQAEDALELARNYNFSLVLTELNLPDMQGLDLLKALHGAASATPLIVLSSLSSPEAKIAALTSGADDYVCKPYHAGELIARLRSLVRRSSGYRENAVRIQDLVIDLDAKDVQLRGATVDLTAKEYAVLELLALRRDRIVTKDMLLDHVYGPFDDPLSKVIEVYICRLRKKLSAQDGDSYIGTLRGRGYMLRDPGAEERRLAA